MAYNLLSKEDYRDLFETALVELSTLRDSSRTHSPGVLRTNARNSYLKLRAAEDDLFRQRVTESQKENPVDPS